MTRREPFQANGADELAVPSNSMPKPLTRDLVARATVTDGAARCAMFSNLVGSEDPGGVRSSTSMSIASPTVTPMGQPVVRERDRRPLEPGDLADQRSKRGHRAADWAAEDGAELLGLLRARALVDVEADRPVAVHQLRLRDVDEENDREILDRGSIDLARVDVEGEHDIAEVLVGRPLKATTPCTGTPRRRCSSRNRFHAAPSSSLLLASLRPSSMAGRWVSRPLRGTSLGRDLQLVRCHVTLAWDEGG